MFLVRKGNPKGIKDWDDLVKPGIAVITPNPKTSGGARWNLLAAWGYALKKELGDFQVLYDRTQVAKATAAHGKAREFVTALYNNVAVLDSGARGSTNTFVQRGTGDVLLAWENEAYLAVEKLGAGKFEIVNPSISILAEPPVAVVDKVVDKRGTRAVAEAYVQFLYGPQGQELAAKHFYRPWQTEVTKKYHADYPAITLFSIDYVFGGWKRAQKLYFDDGGIFDQISQSLAGK